MHNYIIGTYNCYIIFGWLIFGWFILRLAYILPTILYLVQSVACQGNGGCASPSILLPGFFEGSHLLRYLWMNNPKIFLKKILYKPYFVGGTRTNIMRPNCVSCKRQQPENIFVAESATLLFFFYFLSCFSFRELIAKNSLVFSKLLESLEKCGIQKTVRKPQQPQKIILVHKVLR